MQAQERKKKCWSIYSSVLLIGSLSGCATRQWVLDQLSPLDQRVTAAEHRIEETDAKASEALARFNNLRLERQFVLNLKGESEFASGSAVLSQSGRQAVSGFLSDIGNTEGLVFLVAGHTDSVGSEEKNYELGQRRAASVARYLMKQGIDPFRVTTISYGEENPIADNYTAEGKSRNRRVEIDVYREMIASTPSEPAPRVDAQQSPY